MIEVTFIGTTPKQLAEMINVASDNARQGLEALAHETRQHMVDIIGLGFEGKGKRSGSSGDLEQAIQVEKNSEDEYGVGNIAYINRNDVAPYWMLLNNGGMVALKARRVPGFFDGPSNKPIAGLAGTGVGKDMYKYTPRGAVAFSSPGVSGGNGRYLMIVKNPIGGVHYIEKTKEWLKTVIGGKFSAWVNKKSAR